MSPRLAGLSLEQHAGIAVALAEGFARAEVLAQEGVTEAAFRRADIAWKKRLTDDGRQGGALFAAYQEKREQAEDWLRRDVAPLDTDLGAWLGFCELWSSAPDASELLERWGLTLADVGRIGRAWQKRLAGDAELRTRAVELRTSAKAPSQVKVGPARLRPFPWSTPAAAPAAARDEDRRTTAKRDAHAKPVVILPAVPSYLRADARPAAPALRVDAPLSPPSPPQKRPGTIDGFVLPRRKTLPFAAPPAPPAPTIAREPAAAAVVATPPAKGAPAAPAAPRAPSTPAPDPTGPFGTVVSFDVRQILGGRTAPPAQAPPAQAPPLPLTLEEHAAMTLELTLRPGRIAEVLRVAGLDSATKTRLDQHYAALRRSSEQVNAAWEQAYRAAWSAWRHVPWPGPRSLPSGR